jgi:hypothetical protein
MLTGRMRRDMYAPTYSWTTSILVRDECCAPTSHAARSLVLLSLVLGLSERSGDPRLSVLNQIYVLF